MLARLLDVEDPELSRALSRLVDLLTPSMAAEEEPLARRKQELLLNNVSYGGDPTKSRGQECSFSSSI